MLKYKSKAPKVFTFNCRRCQCILKSKNVVRYCDFCQDIVDKARGKI